jgi:hypothetical protein
MEFARQLGKDNNGRLLASSAYLSKRGWNSDGVIDRAKKDLLANGFIFQTVQGQRPNKASWFAVTWYALAPHPAYDPGVKAAFTRGEYRKSELTKIETLNPSQGVGEQHIAPAQRVESTPTTLRERAIRATFPLAPTLSPRNLLDMPSACSVSAVAGDQSASDAHAADQHQRDDHHPTEYWDAERGEFVIMPTPPTRPPYSARASPTDSAQELLALASHDPDPEALGNKERI